MTCRAQLVVGLQDDPSVEARIRSLIDRCEGALGEVGRRRAPTGSLECTFTFSVPGSRSLDEIVAAIGELGGAAVKSVTLLTAPRRPVPTSSEENAHE